MRSLRQEQASFLWKQAVLKEKLAEYFGSIQELEQDITIIQEDMQRNISALREKHELDLSAVQMNLTAMREKYELDVAEMQRNLSALREKYELDVTEVQKNLTALRVDYELDVPEVQRNLNALREKYGLDMPEVQRNLTALSEKYESDVPEVQKNIIALRVQHVYDALEVKKNLTVLREECKPVVSDVYRTSTAQSDVLLNLTADGIITRSQMFYLLCFTIMFKKKYIFLKYDIFLGFLQLGEILHAAIVYLIVYI